MTLLQITALLIVLAGAFGSMNDLFLLIGVEVFAVAFDFAYLTAGVAAVGLALVARLAAVALPDADLQRIAAEFNFSETTFLYPPADPASGRAAATRAALLTETLGQVQNLTIAQGATMGRASFICASTQIGPPVAVTISGNARRTMEGHLVY